MLARHIDVWVAVQRRHLDDNISDVLLHHVELVVQFLRLLHQSLGGLSLAQDGVVLLFNVLDLNSVVRASF